MNDSVERRLSGSISSLSDDECPSPEFQSFKSNSDSSFSQGSKKRRRDDSSQDEESFGSPSKKAFISEYESTDKNQRMMKMDYKKRAGLGSTSTLSEDESSSFESPSFKSNSEFNFSQGSMKRQRDDSSQDEETFEPPSKKFNSTAHRMMANMGYKEGVGLGKHEQGRLNPVEASMHKGRRGLGHRNEKLTEANLQYDPSKEVISIEEEIEWLVNTQQPPTDEELNEWMGIGPSKDSVEDENLYCDGEIVTQVVNSKSVFDNLDKNEMRQARTRSNPFETIRGAIFLNRAAVKMANMDKACNFMFTSPKNLEKGELLYFADVCAGPGGFSEYVLWRKKWYAKGFGFTLRDTNDFKLEDFHAGSPETFHPFYGPKEDGDVYNPENQVAFRRLIMEQTRGAGVHFMMSDGGFSYDGQENKQEILSKQLYLCQCLVALMIVRDGGNFVTKLFDLFTPFSAGLVYIMHRCFERVSIFKPNTSRPANSERYLICQGKLKNLEHVINYFDRVNKILLKKNKNRDVMQLVPHEIIEADQPFYEYLKKSNEDLGRKQIVGLLKIAAFCEDTTLVEDRQAEMRKKCLEYWNVPNTTRTIPCDMLPQDRLQSIMKSSSLGFLGKDATLLTDRVERIVEQPYDWFCVPCNSGRDANKEPATFYMGMGRSKTYRFEKGKWIRVLKLELPADTLVYGELLMEYRGERAQQMKTNALQIIDAYFLGGDDISGNYIEERYRKTKLFTEALWKPMSGESVRVRAKELLPVHILHEKLDLETRIMKNSTKVKAYIPSQESLCNGEFGTSSYFIVPNSLLFLRGTSQNWTHHFSKTHRKLFYHNRRNDKKCFDEDKLPEVDASFRESFETRHVWYWPPDASLTVEEFLHRIHEKLKNIGKI